MHDLVFIFHAKRSWLFSIDIGVLSVMASLFAKHRFRVLRINLKQLRVLKVWVAAVQVHYRRLIFPVHAREVLPLAVQILLLVNRLLPWYTPALLICFNWIRCLELQVVSLTVELRSIGMSSIGRRVVTLFLQVVLISFEKLRGWLFVLDRDAILPI